MKFEKVLTSVHAQILSMLWNSYNTGARYPGGAWDANLTALFDAMAERRPVTESMKVLAEKVTEIIFRWDVRAVGRLRDLWPSAFPKTLSKGKLVAFYDDDGDWAVEVAP